MEVELTDIEIEKITNKQLKKVKEMIKELEALKK